MTRAKWSGAILAESDNCEVVDGNQYFPADAINRQYFRPSEKQTICSWKGTASYYDVVVDGEVNKDAAWYYPAPKDAAKQIKDHVAFWNGIDVENDRDSVPNG